MADPLAQLDQIIQGLGEPPTPKKRRRRQPTLLPDIAPEERSGLLGEITSGVMSGIQFLGETLDKPGRAVRGLLGGKPSELLNLIPFSDSLGITDPAESVSGRNLLESGGLLRPNEPGLDFGDALGAGLEIALDPLILVSGPGKALTKAGQAVAKTGVRDAAGKLLSLPGVTPLRRIEEIARGERGLIGFKNPLHPLSPPAVVFGTGERAAKVADWFHYNPVTRGFRHLFSSNPWLKSFDKTLQKAADQEWAIYQDALAGIEETGVALRQKIPQLTEIFDNELKDYLESNPQLKDMIGGESFDPTNTDDFLRTLAEMRSRVGNLQQVISQPPPQMAQWFHGTGTPGLTPEQLDPFFGSHESLFGHGIYLTDNPDVALGYARARAKRTGTPVVYGAKLNLGSVLDLEKPITPDMANVIQANVFDDFKPVVAQAASVPGATAESVLTALREEVATVSHQEMIPTSEFVEMYQNLAVGLRQAGIDALTHTGGKRTGKQPHKVMIVLDPNDLSQVGRSGHISEFAPVNPERLKFVPPSEAIMEAAAHFDGFTNEILALQDQLAGQLKNMGGSIEMLDDSFIGHTARRMNPAIIDEARKQYILQGGKANRFSFWGGNKRREILKDIPGGTATLQRISKDPRLTANPLPPFATGARPIGVGSVVQWRAGGVDQFPEARRVVGLSPDGQYAFFEGSGTGVPVSQLVQEAGNDLPEAMWERAKILWDEYGIPQIDRTGKTVDDQTDGLVKFFAELPPVALQTGLFGPDIATNALDYAVHIARANAALSATHRLVQDTVSKDHIGPSIDEAFRVLFPKGDSAKWATSHFINEYAKRNGLADLNSIYPNQLYVPEPFLQTARKYLEFSRPEKVEGFLKLWDQVNSLFKGGLYSPFPASHARNFISGLWQNMVTAFTDPKVAAVAFREALNILRGKPSKYTEELRTLLPGLLGRLHEVTGTKATGGIPSLPTMAGVKASFEGSKMPFQKGFTRIDNPLNPLNIRGVREGLEQGSQFPIFRAGEKAAEIVEFLNRATHYIARRETGYEPALAKLQTKAAHFDYASLSDFEKKVLRRVVPFYTFSRKNIALQLKHLLDAPGGRTAQTIRAMNAVRDESDEKTYVPRYLAEGLVIPMGQGATPETSRFFASSGLLPVEEAFNRFSFEQGGPDVVRTLEKTGAQLHPALQAVLEAMTGKELWSGRPLGSAYPFPSDNQDLNYAAYKSPFGRGIRLARTWLDERKGALEKIVNTLIGGAKLTDVDTEKALAIEGKEILTKILRGQPGIRSFERLYSRPADQVEMTPDQLEQLALYQAIEEELKRIIEARAAAKQNAQAQ